MGWSGERLRSFSPLYSGGLWLAVTSHAAVGVQRVYREVDQRRRYLPHLDHVGAGEAQPRDQRPLVALRRETYVTPHGQRAGPFGAVQLAEKGAERLADPLEHRRGEVLLDVSRECRTRGTWMGRR